MRSIKVISRFLCAPPGKVMAEEAGVRFLRLLNEGKKAESRVRDQSTRVGRKLVPDTQITPG